MTGTGVGGSDRRTFLRRAGLLGAGLALAPSAARPQAEPDPCLAPFLHGVASGDPLPDGVMLWTRVTTGDADPVEVGWRVASDVAMTDVVASGTTTTTADRDHTVKVDVPGLAPGRWYFFDFGADGARSVVGRTKTAPDAGVEHLRFGVVSCSNYQHGYFNAYARLAERDDLDAIVHLGDYLYEYGPSGELRDHEPPTEMTTLDEYRGRHGFYKLDPDLRRLHQLFPFVTTWDDHESTNNSWRDGAQNHQAGEGSWQERKAWAQQAYDEWMPIRSESPDRIYRTIRYGDLCDLIMLDTRLDGRDEQISAFDPGVTLPIGEIDDPDRRIMSAEQMSWFTDELSGSKERSTRWRIVGQQVCIGQWNLPGLPDRVLGIELPDVPELGLRDDGNALNPDAWDGYTADRLRFLDHLADAGVDDVVVLTGDVHSSWAMELSPNPADLLTYDARAVEFVAPSVTSNTLGDTFDGILPGGSTLLQAAIHNPVTNPHIKYMDSTNHGYVVIDVTPEAVQADWFFVDTVRRPTDGQRRGASWRVLSGAPVLHEAAAPAPEGAAAPAVPPVPEVDCEVAVPTTGEAGDLDLPAPTLPETGATGAADGLVLPGLAALGAAGLAAVLRRRARHEA